MAKGYNQKLKMLYLIDIFNTYTDEDHGLTLKDIQKHLERLDVNADRKTLYNDFEELRHYGIEIFSDRQGRETVYSIADRKFELSELKLLVDAVQSSRFMTSKQSRELIKKLTSLSSIYDSDKLNRQVILSGRVKSGNEKLLYNVDSLHSAIAQDRRITFQYFQWDENKKMVLRHGGAIYDVSPWALLYDDEYYYLIAFDSKSGEIRHYRVDKMLKISITDNKREGKEVFKKIDLSKYTQGLFGMYAGEEITVTLQCENRMAGPVIDRFGKDIPIIKDDDNHFHTRVVVAASEQFLGWVIALGSGVKIIAPDAMVESMKHEIKRLSEQYL